MDVQNINDGRNDSLAIHFHGQNDNTWCNQEGGPPSIALDLLQEDGGGMQDVDINTSTFKWFPKVLMLQLHNFGSKNIYFCISFLVVARRVFEMVQLGFLMIGNTHEDIDALFN